MSAPIPREDEPERCPAGRAESGALAADVADFDAEVGPEADPQADPQADPRVDPDDEYDDEYESL